MFEICPVPESRQNLLFNLMQKYLYEMTACYANEMDENGNYPYPYLPRYFNEPARHALFFRLDGQLCGFALVNTYAFIPEPVDYCLAEFTVFPGFRRKGLATRAMDELTKMFPGRWQLKYSADNLPAAALWEKIRQRYNGRAVQLEPPEIGIAFERKSN